MLAELARTLICGAALAGLSAVARAQPAGGTSPMPEDRVLLLRNGQVIEGRISQVGDLYYVALPNGQIRVKAAEVERCCRDLEEGYQRKRAEIGADNAQEHLQLAGWCLRHDLFDHAAAELADAARAEPAHPMIGVLKRRLELAREPQEETAHEGASAEGDSPIFAERKLGQSPTARKSGQSPSGAAKRPLSLEDLDRLVRGMPAGSVEMFTQTIQPLLLNNCTSAGCHGPTSQSKFRLLRLPADRPASRRITQRNLHAVVQWVDRQTPAASPLVSAATRPHGTAQTAIFTDRHTDKYRLLTEWVHKATQAPQPQAPSTVAGAAAPSVQAMPSATSGSDPLKEREYTASRKYVSRRSPAADRQAAQRKAPAGQVPTPTQKYKILSGGKPAAEWADPQRPERGYGVQPGGPGEPIAPDDPFDPEVFNRRYFPSQPSSATPAAKPKGSSAEEPPAKAPADSGEAER